MGHNSVILGHPKSTGIPQVDGLSTGPLDLGRHRYGAVFQKWDKRAVNGDYKNRK